MNLLRVTRHISVVSNHYRCLYHVRMMSTSSLELIKELRRRTGAGIGDCKKALEQSNNNIEAAMSYLHSQALTSFSKEGPLSTEGSVGVSRSGWSRGALVDLSSQTDFVSRNDRFLYALHRISSATSAANSLWESASAEVAVLDIPADRLNSIELTQEPGGASASVSQDEALASATSVGDVVSQLRFMFKEDIKIRKAVGLRVHENRGILGVYKHGDGRFGSLVGLVVDRPHALTDQQRQQLQQVGDQLAIHVVARSPLSISSEDSDDESAAAVAVHAPVETTTPEGGEIDIHALAKKQKANTVMLEQPFALDDQLLVRDWLRKHSNIIGVPIVVRAFVRLERGQQQTASTL